MSDQITKAFGNNLKQVDTSPIRFADYSGDINQDGNVDLTDIVNINNNATVFQAGYVLSDLNGDNITDLTDLLIGINNAAVYAVRVTP
jgi:hypothetical protein